MSTSLMANPIWWGRSYPNYLPLSSDQVGNCDTFGALCQTVPVTVSIDLATETITTVVPCSSYLSAMANSLAPKGINRDGGPPFDGQPTWQLPADWSSSFGRSPECQSSFAPYYTNLYWDEYPTSTIAPPPLKGCPSNMSGSLEDLQLYMPPGMIGGFGSISWQCCGRCQMDVPGVRVLYFPDQYAPQCDQSNSSLSNETDFMSIKLPISSPRKRGEIVTAVHSGYTL